MAELREIQEAAWANKLAKGFNTTDVPMEFGLLYTAHGILIRPDPQPSLPSGTNSHPGRLHARQRRPRPHCQWLAEYS